MNIKKEFVMTHVVKILWSESSLYFFILLWIHIEKITFIKPTKLRFTHYKDSVSIRCRSEVLTISSLSSFLFWCNIDDISVECLKSSPWNTEDIIIPKWKRRKTWRRWGLMQNFKRSLFEEDTDTRNIFILRNTKKHYILHTN